MGSSIGRLATYVRSCKSLSAGGGGQARARLTCEDRQALDPDSHHECHIVGCAGTLGVPKVGVDFKRQPHSSYEVVVATP